VPTLATRDAERLLRFVAEAENLGGSEPFTGELLVELGGLIEADYVTYYENDFVRRRQLAYVPRPGDEDESDSELDDEMWELMPEHPICRHWRELGHFRPMKLSDVITSTQLRRTRFYDEGLRPWGIEYELKTVLAGSDERNRRTVSFARKAGAGDFTTRDRLVLDLLRPHLARLWREARARRLLAAAVGVLDRPAPDPPGGVVLFTADGEIDFASSAARSLLETFFGSAAERVPAEIDQWLQSGTKRPLVWHKDGSRLTVDRSGDALLLEVADERPALTAREAEVLSWVARGKTNPQIAELLWLSPATVRKHLENVYGKLGVSTRTAAVARFLGAADGQQPDAASVR
jgi:DNA-binding CsgD family transcriptional regulator